MSSHPLVSVIIPTYNGDRYIQSALESIWQQTYTNYEVIVVDDGSTDDTQAVLEPYRDRISFFAQTNQGVAAARNRGLEVAKGEFVAFLDQDDCFLPHKLAAQVKCLQTNPDIGIVHSGWYRIDDRGDILGKIEPWQQTPQLDLKNWIWWKPVLLGAMMFRKSWLDEVEGFDTQFKQVCDLDLVWRLTLMGCQTKWLPEIFLNYREHDRNDSRNTPTQARESEQILDKLFGLPQLPNEIRKLERECRYYTLVWSAWRLYYTGYLEQMACYLNKSTIYTPMSRARTIFHWVEAFKNYATNYNFAIDTYALTSSQEWQEAIARHIQVS